MIKDICFVTWNRKDFGIESIANKGCEVIEAYKGSKNIIIACIRELHFKLPIPFKAIWYNKRLKGYSGTYIVKDAMINEKFMRWFVKNNPGAHIIFWYWNKITPNKIQPEKVKEMGCDVWSFNVLDCEKHALKVNHTYYCEDYYSALKEIEAEGVVDNLYDLSFVGKDKGRMEYIYDFEQKYPSLKMFIHIVPSHFYLRWKDRRYKKGLPYKTVLKKELESRAILEFVPNGSQGLTIRTMDALCMGKKLVTNNGYVKKADFYNPNNFFVLGEDENLLEFMQKPYIPLREEILEQYTFEKWLSRFFAKD